MNNYFIKIGTLIILTSEVTSYEVVDQDYDVDPGRTIDGELFRNRVAMIPEVTFSVRPLNQTRMGQILAELVKTEFTAEFYHPVYGTYKKAEFYCGPSSRKVKMRKPLTTPVMYEEHTFTLTGIHNVRNV